MRGRYTKTAVLLLLVFCFCLTALGAGDGQIWEDGFGDLDNGSGGGSGSGGWAESGGTDGGDGWSDGFQDGQAVNRALAALSQDPVAMMPVSNIGVNTSASGCYVNNVTWYDSQGVLGGDAVFGTGSVRVEIRLMTLDGYYFPNNAAGYINNSPCDIQWESANSVVLSKDYAPAIWDVTIVNNPKSKTVDPGKWADFWVSGLYAKGYEWYLVSPSGAKLALKDIQTQFPNVPVPENNKDTLIINNVPLEMDGWKVVCTFISAGDISRKDSQAATITVRGAKASPSPSPSASPSPSPTPSAAPSASPSPGPGGQPVPEDHEHSFPVTWTSDETGHWHECVCGERSGFEEHTLTWTVAREATKKESGLEEGACEVCGYQTSRELPYEEDGLSSAMRGFRITFFVVLALLVVGIVILIVQSVRDSRRRRRRRRR